MMGALATAAVLSLGAAAEPPPRFFAHVNFGFNVVTHAGATAAAPAATYTPANRIMIFEQVGVGHWVHPNVRLQVSLLFGQTLSGLPAGASPITLVAVMPLAVLTWKGAFVGAGPLLAPRAFGTATFHSGLFTFFGYGFPIGHGVSLGLAVQVPVMLAPRVSVAVTPAVLLAYRF